MFVRPKTYKPISGKGTKATIPSRDNMQSWEVGYLSTDLQVGEWAYNSEDKIWFQRTSSGIKETYDPDFKTDSGGPVLEKEDIKGIDLTPVSPIKIEGLNISLLYDAESLFVKDGVLYAKQFSQEELTIKINDSLEDVYKTVGSQISKTAEQINQSVNMKIWGTDGAGGNSIKEEYTSLISQTAKAIELSVNKKIWGSNIAGDVAIVKEFNSNIKQTAEEINLSVDAKLNTLETGVTESFNSEISQMANSINLSVNQKIWGTDQAGTESIKSTLESEINVQAGRISFVVDSTNGVNTVKAGIIVDAINSSSVTIAAERVNIAGAAIFTEIDNNFTGIDNQFTSVNQSLSTLNQDVLGKLSTGSAAADINGHETTIHGGKITTGTITSLGLVESFTGLFVKDDTAPGDKYVYGVTKSSANGKLYPKMFIGERRTWNYASTTDIASGFIVERDSADDKYKFHIGDNLSYLNYDGGKLRLGGVTLTEIVDGIPTDIYKIVNGTVVFQLPLASISDISAYSSLTPPPTSWWNGLSAQVDQTTIGYVNGRLSVLAAPNAGVSSWTQLQDKPAWLLPTTLTDFQNAHNHNSLYHPIGGGYDKDFSVRNLTIYGEVTEYQAQVIVVDNAFVKVNTGNSEVDAGLIVETSDVDDARLFYDVSENAWKVGEGQNYGTIWDSRNFNPNGKQDFATAWNTGNFNPNNYLLSTYLAGRRIDSPDSAVTGGVSVYYNTLNSPISPDSAVLTMAYSQDWAWQLAGDWRSGNFKVRCRNNSVWGNWYEGYHSGNLNRSDTDFTAKNLTIGGELYVTTGIYPASFNENINLVNRGGAIVFKNSSDVEYARINNDGKVGIGILPSEKLDVLGDIKFGDGIYHRYLLGTNSNFSGMYLYDVTRQQYVLNVRDSDGFVKIKYGLHSEYGSIYSQDNGNGYLELATFQGNLPGYPSDHYATLKSNSNIHFAPNDTYVGYLADNGIHVTANTQFVNDSDSRGFKSNNFHGLVGDYDTNGTTSKIIWTIGDNWNTIESHYGLGYEYSNFGHTYVVRSAGTTRIKLGDGGDIWGQGSLSMNGDITASGAVRGLSHRSPAFKIIDASNNVLWTLKADASGNLEFRNAADALVMLLTTAGKLSCKDDVEGFKTF